MGLPGHIPDVQTGNVHDLLRRAPAEMRKRFYELWHDLFYRQPPEAPPADTFSMLEQGDIDDLLQHRIIEPAVDSLVPNTSMFRVLEPEKNRARIITWTQWVNTIDYRASQYLSISPPERPILTAEGMHSAVVADLKAAFYQIEIPPEARHRFVFEHKGRLYQFTRLPMGARQSAEMCAIYLQVLTRVALHDVGEEKRLDTTIFHIDNVRVPACEASGAKIESALRRLAARFNATWGECQWARKYDFLGFSYDHELQTIEIRKKKLDKLKTLKLQFFTDKGPRSARDFLKITGRCLTYARALAMPSAATRNVFRINAQLFASPNLDKTSTISAGDRWHVYWLLATLSNARPIALYLARPVESRLHLYTDASLEGYGAVLTTSSTYRVLSVRKRFDTINEAEIYALDAALRHFYDELRHRKVSIYMDSQVALACMANLKSAAQHLDKLVQRVTKRLNRLDLSEIDWVKIDTSENPADAPSRDRDVNVDLPSLRGIIPARLVYNTTDDFLDEE